MAEMFTERLKNLPPLTARERANEAAAAAQKLGDSAAGQPAVISSGQKDGDQQQPSNRGAFASTAKDFFGAHGAGESASATGQKSTEQLASKGAARPRPHHWNLESGDYYRATAEYFRDMHD